MKRFAIFSMMVLAATILSPPPAHATSTITLVAAAATGVYPPGTTFNGVPIDSLRLSSGVEVGPTGTALGELTVTLVGNVLGVEQDILIEAEANAGTMTAANVAVFSGKCTIDMGDGSPPLPDVTFSATITADGSGAGTIALVLGITTLPVAPTDDGTVVIRLR